MSCKDCVKVAAASPNESSLIIPHGEDWVIEDRFKDGDDYYNADNATFEMFIKDSEYDDDDDALFQFEDSDFDRTKSDEATAASVAFNDQFLLIIHWDNQIASLDKDVPYWYYIKVTDPTLGIDKVYDRGEVEFSSE